MVEKETLRKIKNRKVVPFLGCCNVQEEWLLIYLFMLFGNIKYMLHCKRKEDSNVGERKKIACGAAKGVLLCPLQMHSPLHTPRHEFEQRSPQRGDGAQGTNFAMARLIGALDTHLSVSTLAWMPSYVQLEYYYQSF